MSNNGNNQYIGNDTGIVGILFNIVKITCIGWLVVGGIYLFYKILTDKDWFFLMIVGIAGLAVLLCLLGFILSFVSYITSGYDNDMKARQEYKSWRYLEDENKHRYDPIDKQ